MEIESNKHPNKQQEQTPVIEPQILTLSPLYLALHSQPSKMCSLAESKTNSFPELNEDGYYYINGLKITGVAAVEVDYEQSKVGLCIENRTAHTKEEQKEFGLPQPFLLAEISKDAEGNEISQEKIAEAFIAKMEKKGKEIKFSPEMNDDPYRNTVQKIIWDAKTRYYKFKDRRFPMIVKRESLNANETGEIGLKRLLREEFKKKFKSNASIPKYSFVYERRKQTCLLVYLVESSSLECDTEALAIQGEGTYFCSHSLPEICDNSYYETRNHTMVTFKEADKIMEKFSAEMNMLKCDLSRWGGKKFWDECKTQIYMKQFMKECEEHAIEAIKKYSD